MWTRLIAATAALLAAVAAVWWIVQPDDTRALGLVSVLVVAQPPSSDGQGAPAGEIGTGNESPVLNPCTGLSAGLAPNYEVEWSSATQGNGLRACRWIRTWRISDLLTHPLPGEPRAELANQTLTVTLDPLLPEQGKGVTTLDVTVSFPGEVLSRSGTGPAEGSTVEWSNPEGFFSGVGLTATGRERPQLVAAIPWVVLALALLGFGAAVPWRRSRPRQPRLLPTEAADRTDSAASSIPSPGSPAARGQKASGPQVRAAVAARPAGHDPDSPWRPPSPH